jgi:DNA-binding HxlR family transcriptional regulator
VVGERWSLLIVRELLIREPLRYTDLRYGLPGIATNLLADRLRELEEAGLIQREDAPPPIATTLFRLTARGRELQPVLKALGRWGSPLVTRPIDGEEFRSHWLALPLESNLVDHAPRRPPVTIEVWTGEHPMLVTTKDGGVRVRPGRDEAADARMTGTPSQVLGVFLNKLDLATAKRRGLKFEGDLEALRRVQPES